VNAALQAVLIGGMAGVMFVLTVICMSLDSGDRTPLTVREEER
jgi:hypothetical protein